MTDARPPLRKRFATVSLALGAGAAGYGLALWMTPASSPVAQGPEETRKPLYWYDPMVPSQHFDKGGKSPFMDMQLVPKYGGDGAATEAAAGLDIDPSSVQSLGMRVVAARLGALPGSVTATGMIDFNQRDMAIVQTRAGGFVSRVYGRAPGDVVAPGAPLADLLVPEWSGAQTEYLVVRRSGNSALALAARQRLTLLGMPEATIAMVERTGHAHTVTTIATPLGGVIRTLMVRQGMTLMAGQTLAEISALGTVWLDAAVPEAVAGPLRPGQTVTVTLAALPGETYSGRISAILPETRADSHTTTVRVTLPNRGGRLRPGMYAQVAFAGNAHRALLVPSEALIRTGRHTLVMLALAKGRYQPAEVVAGQEAGGDTEILEGLHDGEKVVASGQFLIDSEASLSGIQPRALRDTMRHDMKGAGK